jgi:hypothetical protein
MARFIQAEFPLQHDGVARIERGFRAIGSYSITQAVLHVLAVIGTPVTLAARKVRAGLVTVYASRRQRKADDQLWNVALSDARVMADLSRAMSRDAQRLGRSF